MLDIRRILVAVKDPQQRRPSAALRKAVQLAKACNAKVEAFHALTSPIQLEVVAMQNRSLQHFQREQRSEVLQQLARQVKSLARSSGVEITPAVDSDAPAYEATIRHAQRTGADLIVADIHHGRHVPAWRMQLTDWELLRHSPLPVLLVKSPRGYRKPRILAAIDPSHAYAKTDKLDQDVLAAGTAISEALQGSLHALHAYVPLPAGLHPAELRARGIELELQDFTAMAAKRRFTETLRGTSIPGSRRILSTEHPDSSIPQTAAKLGCGIVVMGALSRSGLKRLFIGNTAERVLDALRCDVLIIKQQPFKSGVKRARKGVAILASPLPMGF
jgi:universal stress protein E